MDRQDKREDRPRDRQCYEKPKLVVHTWTRRSWWQPLVAAWAAANRHSSDALRSGVADATPDPTPGGALGRGAGVHQRGSEEGVADRWKRSVRCTGT